MIFIKKYELQKIISSFLLTSYIFSLTPIYAANKDLGVSDRVEGKDNVDLNAVSNLDNSNSYENENYVNNTDISTLNTGVEVYNWLDEVVASQLDKEVTDLTEDDYLKITKIDLSWNDLYEKTIPSSISKLKNLEILNLSMTGIGGNIPNEIGDLKNLKELVLYGNELNGEIPSAIGNLSNLEVVQLMNNNLSSGIPSSIGNLSNLKELNLSGNKLSGSIPDTIGNLSKLTTLDLSSNALSSEIPESIGNLKSIINIELGKNSLEGEIPSTIGNLSTLEYLGLYENSLTQNIPDEITNLTSLKYLLLHNNVLEGSLPNNIGNLSELVVLRVDNNKLSGELPESLDNLDNLSFSRGVWISSFDNNQFIGTVSEKLLSKANKTTFENNFLSNVGNQKSIKFSIARTFRIKLGEVLNTKDVINNIVVLNYKGYKTNETLSSDYNLTVNISDKELFDDNYTAIKSGSSSIKVGILNTDVETSNYHSIQTYNNYVANNWLNKEVAKQNNKNYLDLVSEDYLNIEKIDLSGENINASIPSDISKLKNLKELNLSGSNIYGNIPNSLYTLTKLEKLNLSNNKFNGLVSNDLNNLSQLILLDLSNNKFSGEFPNIESLVNLESIDISSNCFTGNVPEYIFNLENLDFNNSSFANNQLVGTIPNTENISIMSKAFENNLIENLNSQKSINLVDANINVKLGNSIADTIDNKYIEILDKDGNQIKENLSEDYSLNLLIESSNIIDDNTAVKVGETSYSVVLGDTSIVSANTAKIVTYNDVVEDNWLNREIARQLKKDVKDLIESDYKKITSINLSNSNLYGEIPEDIYKLSNLKELDLSNNKLTGELPYSLLTEQLNSYDFSNNSFTGTIAKDILVKIDTEKLSNNFISNLDNQYKIVVNGDIELKLEKSNKLDKDLLLSNIKIVGNDNYAISLDDSYSISIESDNENIINSSLAAVDYGEAYLNLVLLKNNIEVLREDKAIKVLVLDTEKPVLKTELSNSKWTNKSVTLKISAKDNVGVNYIELPNGKIIYSDTASLKISKNGKYTIKAYDKSGNYTTKTITINNIDTTKAVAKIKVSKPDKNNKVKITITASDKNSGLNKISFSGKQYTAKSTNTFTVTKNGNYTVKLSDKAGNISEYTVKVNSIKPSKTKYTVNISSLNLINKASNKGKVVFKVKKGTKVDVVEIKNGWAKIIYKNKTVYCLSKYLKK